ncbi:MAG: recombinase family protein [Pirellulales bacterium]
MGLDRNRPGLTRLLADVAAGEVDRVVVYRLDRFEGRLAYCAAFLRDPREHDVAFTVITSPELEDSAQDTLALNLLSSFAEFELEVTRERMRDARESYKQRGLRVAGVVPIGYTTDPSSKQLVLVDEDARRVLELFRMIAAGQTPSQVATSINQRGRRTKERPSRRSGRRSGGNLWAARQVFATISNPVYRGLIQNGRERLPGEHHAIVSEELWSRARSQGHGTSRQLAARGRTRN